MDGIRDRSGQTKRILYTTHRLSAHAARAPSWSTLCSSSLGRKKRKHPGPQRRLRVVVGRSVGRAGDGADCWEGGSGRAERESVLRELRMSVITL
jgi:hypothetical protein